MSPGDHPSIDRAGSSFTVRTRIRSHAVPRLQRALDCNRGAAQASSIDDSSHLQAVAASRRAVSFCSHAVERICRERPRLPRRPAAFHRRHRSTSSARERDCPKVKRLFHDVYKAFHRDTTHFCRSTDASFESARSESISLERHIDPASDAVRVGLIAHETRSTRASTRLGRGYTISRAGL